MLAASAGEAVECPDDFLSDDMTSVHECPSGTHCTLSRVVPCAGVVGTKSTTGVPAEVVTTKPRKVLLADAPFECTSAGHFADRDDCGKFIVCQDAGDNHFIEHSMPCPSGLYFNPETHQCDYPKNV